MGRGLAEARFGLLEGVGRDRMKVCEVLRNATGGMKVLVFRKSRTFVCVQMQCIAYCACVCEPDSSVGEGIQRKSRRVWLVGLSLELQGEPDE